MKAEDASYRRIVRAANEWRAKTDSRKLDPDEQTAFAAWLAEDIRHEEVYDQAVTLWSAYEHLDIEDIDPDLRRVSLVEQYAQLSDFIKDALSSWRWRAITVAAAVLFIATPVLLIKPGPEQAVFVTEIGQNQAYELSDGSVLTLSADSQVQVVYTEDARTVRLLEGAALFDVVPDRRRTFTVDTDTISAAVTGTVFEVRSSAGVQRVAVAEGGVLVTVPDFGAVSAVSTNTVELIAGEQIAFSLVEGIGEVETIAPDQVASWQDEVLLYSDATLEEIVADLGRYSERQIILVDVPQNIAKERLSASFRTDDMEDALRALERLYAIEIDTSDPDTIRVVGR